VRRESDSQSRSEERCNNLSRLRWQCRRGMRELDELLLQYLEDRYGQAGADEKAAFRALLELPDPELIGYLLHQHPHPPDLVVVIGPILKRTRP
jgi:antitoxin CptB